MLPWLLATVTLAAVVLTAPSLGRHLFEVFDNKPQPAWDRWLNPIELAVLRWIGDTGRSAESTGAYLVPLLISNALFGLLALTLLLVQAIPGLAPLLGLAPTPPALALGLTALVLVLVSVPAKRSSAAARVDGIPGSPIS